MSTRFLSRCMHQVHCILRIITVRATRNTTTWATCHKNLTEYPVTIGSCNLSKRYRLDNVLKHYEDDQISHFFRYPQGLLSFNPGIEKICKQPLLKLKAESLLCGISRDSMLPHLHVSTKYAVDNVKELAISTQSL